MTPRNPNQLSIAAALSIAVVCITFATDAGATCVTPPLKTRLAAATEFGLQAAQAVTDRDASDARDALDDARESLVGMWKAEFLVGDALYDQTFQQFHSDGTENILSNGLPPALGNICLGVWKQIGPRTFRLRHMAWNWDAEGRFAGLFEMFVTLRVDRNGRRYSGTFIADSYDLSNRVIPELHTEGTVRAVRIIVD